MHFFAILISEFGNVSTVIFFVFHIIITGSHSNQWKTIMFISMGKEVLFRVVISPDSNATMGHHKVKVKDFIDLKSKIWIVIKHNTK